MKQSFEQTGAGSPKTTSPSNQRKAGLSPDCQTNSTALLSRKEVAQRWHCCVQSVYRRKDLTPVRFSRRFLRYRLTDIEAIEAAGLGYAQGGCR
jgi:hypothetical protein